MQWAFRRKICVPIAGMDANKPPLFPQYYKEQPLRAALFACLHPAAIQAMMVAVPVQDTSAAVKKACFRIAFRIKLHHFKPVGRGIGKKGKMMLLCHGMGGGDIQLMLHVLILNFMSFIRFLCLQRRKGNAAAGYHSLSRRMQDIAADRTDINGRPQDIGCAVCIDDLFPGKQLRYRQLQCPGQRLQQGDIRKSLARFP